MKIWHYTRVNPQDVGGVETHINSLSRELLQLGHDVHIGRDIPLKWREPSPDKLIFHTHGDLWVSLSLLRASKRFSATRWIHVCHGTSVGRVLACREYASFSGWKGSLRDFLPTRFAHAAVAVSSQALVEARRYFGLSIPATVIANGANPHEFAPLASISSAPRVAFVGRGSDRVKNVRTLLSACDDIFREHPDFELWAAPRLEPLRPYLKNLGVLSGKRLAQALAECRGIILCSFYEGDPIVLREAQALGLPIIASDLPQIRQNLGSYPGASLIDPHRAEGLSRAIISLCYDTPLPRPTPFLRSWKDAALEFEAFYKST